jgi:hypothetical protein
MQPLIGIKINRSNKHSINILITNKANHLMLIELFYNQVTNRINKNYKKRTMIIIY